MRDPVETLMSVLVPLTTFAASEMTELNRLWIHEPIDSGALSVRTSPSIERGVKGSIHI